MSFSVATYNVHRFVGVDGLHNPERTKRVLLEMRPDFIGLQEADTEPETRSGENPIEYLARAAGLRAYYGPTIQRENGHYGNVFLTSRPVLETRRIDLSVPGREPRGAIDVDVDADGTVVRFIVTHFGLRPSERRFQTRRLLDLLSQSQTPSIVLADINEWLPVSPTLWRLASALGPSSTKPTFPSRFPLFALDRVWVKGCQVKMRTRVHKTALAQIASDHLPLVATISLEEG